MILHLRLLSFCFVVALSGKVSASNLWDQRINQLHEARQTYCQWYSADVLCGGDNTEAVTQNQQAAQIHVQSMALDLSQAIVFSRQYATILTNLDSEYAAASEDKKATIELLASYLNAQWLNRFQPELDYWFSTTQSQHSQNLGLGYALYTVIFAANPQPRLIKQAHKVLRVRMPWTALSLGLAGTGTWLAHRSAQLNKPMISPPPFHFLSFGDREEPGADLEAQISHAEYRTISETFANNAGVLAVLAMGPNWKALSAAGTATRFVFLSRTLAATRVTPLSFIGGLIVTELVKWTWSRHRAGQLIEQMEAFKATGTNSGQEISLLINAFHILFLADVDTALRDMEAQLSNLANSDLNDPNLAAQFSGWALNQPHFATFKEQPVETNAKAYLNHRRAIYTKFIQRTDKLIERLAGVEVQDPLIKAAIELRVSSLRQQRQEAQQKLQNFPMDILLARLMQLFPGVTR